MAKRCLGLVTSFTPEIFRCEYFTRIISGIIDALRNTNYDLRFIMVSPESQKEPEKIFEEHAIDGLMFLTWTIHPEIVGEAQRRSENLPIVLVNDYTPDIKTNIVYCNN